MAIILRHFFRMGLVHSVRITFGMIVIVFCPGMEQAVAVENAVLMTVGVVAVTHVGFTVGTPVMSVSSITSVSLGPEAVTVASIMENAW